MSSLSNPVLSVSAALSAISKDIIEKEAKKLHGKFRKVITGSSDKRIRDRVKETQDEPKFVKFFDKCAFTFGVMNLAMCQYFLLNQPQYFWLWYSVIIPTLMLARFLVFKSQSLQYFLLDFCYFTLGG